MKIYAEKEAEEFLKEQGFDVVETYFCNDKNSLLKVSKKFGFPLVIKISGKKIIHKNKLNGVFVGVYSKEQLLNVFEKFMKKKNVEGVILQKQVFGKEFILGIKNTEDFGQVIAFGLGGIKVEEIKQVFFRVPPLTDKEIFNFIDDIKIKLNSNEKKILIKNIKLLCGVSEKFPNIGELDINPLILSDKFAVVVDARICFN